MGNVRWNQPLADGRRGTAVLPPHATIRTIGTVRLPIIKLSVHLPLSTQCHAHAVERVWTRRMRRDKTFYCQDIGKSLDPTGAARRVGICNPVATRVVTVHHHATCRLLHLGAQDATRVNRTAQVRQDFEVVVGTSDRYADSARAPCADSDVRCSRQVANYKRSLEPRENLKKRFDPSLVPGWSGVRLPQRRCGGQTHPRRERRGTGEEL